MTAIRTLLVDDEPLATRGLQIRLKTYPDIDIIGAPTNGREAVRAIKQQKPDLVFLDIQMPGFDGFSVVRSLVGETVMPLIVFVTAYDQYALDAFEAHALDYLLKPIEDTRLAETIARVRAHLAQRSAIEQTARLVAFVDDLDVPLDAATRTRLTAILDRPADSRKDQYDPHLRIKDRGHIAIVPVRDIEFIDAAGDYMCIHVGNKTHILRETMKTMEKRLNPRLFQRIHRSTIVNLDLVQAIKPHSNGECFLTLKSGKELKVSRSYKDVIGRFL